MERIDRLSWGVSGACLVGSFVFPSYAKSIWVFGVMLLLPVLWIELRKPVNYASLKFNSRGFVFQESAALPAAEASWSEVKEVFYIRVFNDFANQIDTEWQFVLKGERNVKVLVEWPDRSKFTDAIIENLCFVSAEAVRRAIAQRVEGRWSVGAEEASA
jgi:hypothetical protein